VKERCKRSSPNDWVNYLTTSRVIKIIRDHGPCFLFFKLKLVSNYYEEHRLEGRGMFFDTSKSKISQQSLENIQAMFKGLDCNWTNGLNDDQIRILKLSAVLKCAK